MRYSVAENGTVEFNVRYRVNGGRCRIPAKPAHEYSPVTRQIKTCPYCDSRCSFLDRGSSGLVTRYFCDCGQVFSGPFIRVSK